MADGRAKNGGARAGAGRKPKVVEDDLHRLLKKCFTKGAREKVLRRLVEDASSDAFSVRHESRKLLYAYAYGKPAERGAEGAGGGEDDDGDEQLTLEQRIERVVAVVDRARARRDRTTPAG